jgi:hypothetical protein
LPYLVVQGRGNPVNNPSYAQDFCVGEGERKEKKKKERSGVGKERKKKYFVHPQILHFLLIFSLN